MSAEIAPMLCDAAESVSWLSLLSCTHTSDALRSGVEHCIGSHELWRVTLLRPYMQ
jgi:hypothetical protein